MNFFYGDEYFRRGFYVEVSWLGIVFYIGGDVFGGSIIKYMMMDILVIIVYFYMVRFNV